MRRLIVAATFVFLTACGGKAGLVSTELTESQWESLTPMAQLYVIESDRTAVLKAISPYLQQPYCTETVVVACKDRAVVEPLQDLDNRMEQTMNYARETGGELRVAAVIQARSLLLEFVAKALAAGYGG